MRILRLLSFLCLCAATAFSGPLSNAQKLFIQPAVSTSDVNASLPVAVDVNGTGVIATGTATLTGGGYSSGAQTLDHNGDYVFIIPANTLSLGTDTLTVNYSGDSNYAALTGSITVKVGASVPLEMTVIGPVATQVGAGAGHTCVLTAQSITQPETIQCWGSNNHGQLGNGTITDTTTPVQVDSTFYTTRDQNDLEVISLAVGDNHTCALLPDSGQVTCWGANASGQLGNGNTADSSTPVLTMNLKILARGVALAAGSAHTCALLEDGTAQCWGDNTHGQLGDGSFANSTSPVAVSGLSNAIAIAAGGNHTCALLSDESVVCWGENGNGQLGNNSIKDSSTPVVVGDLGGSATLLALGGTHTCALLTDGTLNCWGGNAHGQLGNGSIVDSPTPVAVSGLIGATTLAAGKDHTCAVVAAGGGIVECWGSNADGQLGDSSITDRTVPVHTGGLTKVTALTLGGSHSCAQNDIGVLACWGDNSTGQLGNATKQAGGVLSPLPVNGMGGSPATLSVGYVYACSLTTGGTASLGSGGTLTTNGAPFCWGSNGGELGNGLTADSATPVEVLGLTNTVKAVFTGTLASCAVLTDGSVDCWGGDVNTVKSPIPVKITGFSGTVLQLSISPYSICALISNGTVQCWGSNYYGGLGDGTNNDSATPVTVVGIISATAISGRNTHTCALLSGGTVACWGDGKPTPATVGGLSSAKAISAGQDFNCALLPDSTVQCWGLNSSGQLGNGKTSDNPTGPGPVVGLSGVSLLSAGAGHVCALLSDTTVQCWGNNQRGQLGNGTTSNSSIPSKVSGLTGVTTISSGDEVTLALVADGTLQGWGNNDGQPLGDSEGMSSNDLRQDHYVFPVPVFEGQSIEFDPPQSLAVGASVDLAPLAIASSGLTALFDAWTIDDCSLSYPVGGSVLSVLSSTQPLLCGVRAVQTGGYNLHGGSLAPASSKHRSIAVGASVLTPHATLSPTGLAFGSINVGVTSAAQTLTLSNSGGAPLNIGGISITGADAIQFNQTNSCGSTLAAGASCTLSVGFAPNSAASANAVISVADNAAGSPQTAALSGTGTAPGAPKAALTPAVLDFGSISVGASSAAQTFTLTNAGTAALPITATGISGLGAASFTIASNACGASLAASANCKITVIFTPSAAGTASASLNVYDSVGIQTASISGTGVAPASALTITPSSLNFGNVIVGQTKTLSVTLTNVSTTKVLPLTVLSSDPAINLGSFIPSCSVTPLAVGGSCTGSISFTPTAAKSYSPTITLGVVETGCSVCTIVYPNQTIAVTGVGVAPPPALTITPSSLTFGNVIVGQTKSLSMTLTNVSGASVSPAAISSSDPAINVASLLFSCSSSLLAGGSCTGTVTFTPTTAKSYSATITLGGIVATCSGCLTVYPNQTIAVTGVGTTPPPALTIAPSSLNFGTVIVGQTKTLSVTLTNVSSTGVLPLAISSSDPAIDTGSFTLSCGTKPIPAGGSCTATFSFTPTAAKSYSATITVGSITATGCSGCTITYPNQTIATTGVGTVPPPALTITPSSLNFGNVTIGQTKTLHVTLVNVSSTSVLPVKTISSSDPAIGLGSLILSCGLTPLPVGGGCTGDISFTPTAVKNYSATITLGNIATGCGGCTTVYPDQTIAVTAVGTLPLPALDIAPSPINFGNVVVGLTKTQSIDVVNLSSTTVSIQTITSSDPAISFTGSCTAKPIAVGVHCSELVHFTPTATKNYSATITLGKIIATDCGGCTTVYANQPIAVTGTGVTPPPALDIAPSPISLGNVVVGLTKSQSIDVVNLSSTTVSIQTITSSDPAILITGSCTAKPIAVGVHCSELVHFTPTATKNYSATITLGGIIATDCAGCKTNYPNQTLSVTGTGVAAPPALLIAPSPINLGNVIVGQTKTQTVEIENNSSTPVSALISSTDPALDISSLNSACSFKPIAVGVHCVAIIRFTPTVVKNYSFTITLGGIIATGCGGCTVNYPTQTISVTGTGVAPLPALGLLPSPINFGNVDIGQTKAQSMDIANLSTTAVLVQTITSSDPSLDISSLIASCGVKPLAVGMHCAPKIRFTPTAAKNYSATITLGGIIATACGGCKTSYPNQIITVSGTGVGLVPPSFSPLGGSFISKQSVTLSNAAPGSVVFFTVDGSIPTANSAVYTSPIEVDSTETIRAIAVLGGASSAVSSASYTIALAGCQTIDYSSGFTASGLSLNGGATISGSALELTDGGPSEARSAFFSTALPTTSFTTDFTLQITDPVADGMTFTIQSNNAKALGQGGGGLGYAGIPHSVAIKVDLHNNAGEGTDSTGTYIDGAYPSIPSINLAPAGIDLHSGHIFAGHLAYASGVTKATIKDTVTGVSASMNFPGDITTVVGNNAWFGFTAGTGGNSATQKILTWSYSGGAGCPAK